VPSIVTFNSDTQYEFTHWHDDETALSRIIVVTSPAEYTAYYARVLKSSYILPLSLSSETIKIDETITVSGSIGPAHEGVLVTLTHKKPDGSTLNRTVTSSSGGKFSATYKLDAAETWSVTASWPGDVDHLGATSPTASFEVERPPAIDWWDYLRKPQIIGLFVALFSVICTVTAFVATRRKRGRIKSLLNEIDNIYYRFKMNARRCEAELYRLRDMVLEDYKNGKITEQSYDILNERINDYLNNLLGEQ